MLEHHAQTLGIMPVALAQQERAQTQRVELVAFEQDLQHRVVASLYHVIWRLFIVGIGAAIEQQPRQFRMLRDSGRAVDRRFDHGPRIRMVDHLDPAGVSARAGIEQSAGGAHKGVGARTIEPEVSRETEISEGVPAAGPAFGGGVRRIASEEIPHSGFVGNNGGGIDAARRSIRVSRKDFLGLIKRSRAMRMTRHAGGSEERRGVIGRSLIGHLSRIYGNLTRVQRSDSKSQKITGAAVGVIFLMTGVATQAHAQAFADLKNALVDYSKADLEPRKACETLGRFKSAEIAQITAASVPAAGMTPAHCRVTGLLSPEIAFEVSLPAKWNGRFYMIGNGGLAGEAMDDPGRVAQRNAALQVGFAFAQTNTGHDAKKEPSGSFVLSNPEKATDYAWRAVHLTAVTTRAITKDYYGKPVSRAYWNSCSNGGRQGLLEAQRFPQDFDGVIANSPWVDQTGFTIGAMWNQKALTAAPVSPAKLAMVGDKVMAKCDADRRPEGRTDR